MYGKVATISANPNQNQRKPQYCELRQRNSRVMFPLNSFPVRTRHSSRQLLSMDYKGEKKCQKTMQLVLYENNAKDKFFFLMPSLC